jgi:AGCS family alanine or glycine:cation symporter
VQPWLTGLFLLVFTGLIILGGVKRIAQFSAFFVPILAVSYVGVAFFIMLTNIERVPEVFGIIFSNAFNGHAVAGGSIGTVIAIGIRRGLFSNEAGLGSAPAAAAAASTSHPVKQGLIQSFSVFTDTIIVCTATAFIVVLAGLYTDPNITGIVLMQRSLVAILGSWSQYYLTIIIFMFAFSSVVGNYYYGESSLIFIQKGAQWPLKLYKITVVVVVFLGSIAGYDLVWALGDFFSGLTAGINLYALILLYPLAVKLLKDFEKQRKAGLDPVFKSSSMPEVKVECWD